MKINCIAIDDEPLALDKIREYIKRIGYLNLLSTFDNAIDAIDFIKTNQVELIFLDIQMEELTGIQMLEAMHDKPKVVLTTAYDEYALKGYELDVTDYLLKPISFQRFLKACEKVYKLIDPEITNENVKQPESDEDLEYFFVKNGSKTQKIDFEDILFVEGMKDYLRIWTAEEKVMKDNDYPKFTEHHKLHEDFKARLNLMVQDFEEEGATSGLSQEITTYLNNWLVTHIKGIDTELGKILQEKGFER